METYFTGEDGTARTLPKAPRAGWTEWNRGTHRCGVYHKRIASGVSLRDGRRAIYRCERCVEAVIDHSASAPRRLGVLPLYGDAPVGAALGWV